MSGEGERREDPFEFVINDLSETEWHWFVHRYLCARDEDILLDDGDPAWEDIDTYRPEQRNRILRTSAVWATREGPEIFIDIPNTSRYREEVLRIRTKTMSPAFLKSYRELWEVRSMSLRRKVQIGELNDFMLSIRLNTVL